MDSKEIGAFLKRLRKVKGITQEQLAEILGVSGRTVSRWETGANLPDLSILVEISEYYGVESKEILKGKREGVHMDNELKETLLKVADYNALEKQRAAKAGNLSFTIMFLVCAAAITLQILMSGNLSLVAGETAVLLAGGLVYLFFTVKYGAWNAACIHRSPKKDVLVSLICTGIFSIVFWLLSEKYMDTSRAIGAAICFFVVFSTVSYAFLCALTYLSQKKSGKSDSPPQADGGSKN